MSWRRPLAQLRSPFGRRRGAADLRDEIRAHLEMEVCENLDAGMSPAEARRAALRRFGNVTLAEERSREMWQWDVVATFFRDLRYGSRLLRKRPGFGAVAILSIAIGMGASTTTFSWIRGVFLNPLPGAGQPARVVALETLTPSAESVPTSYPDFRDYRDHADLLESATVAYAMRLAFGRDTSIQNVWGELVSGSYFEVLRVEPELGAAAAAFTLAIALSAAATPAWRAARVDPLTAFEVRLSDRRHSSEDSGAACESRLS